MTHPAIKTEVPERYTRHVRTAKFAIAESAQEPLQSTATRKRQLPQSSEDDPKRAEWVDQVWARLEAKRLKR